MAGRASARREPAGSGRGLVIGSRNAVRIACYSPRPSHLELEPSRGGDPIFLHNLFDALRRRGHEIEIVSSLDLREVWRGRVPARRLLREAIEIRGRMKRFSPDAWLVYDTSRTYPDLFGWWQRPRRYVLLSAHTWQSDRLPRAWRWLFASAHRLSLSRADRVLAARPTNAERLRRHGVAERRLATLPPAVPIRPSVPAQSEARLRLGLPLEASIVLCVSRLTEPGSKDRKTEIVLQLLDSVFERPEEKRVVVIVGDGPGRALVDERAARIGGRSVLLFPSVPNEDLTWFFAACDVYAYPDCRDQPRLSVLEAQACGRPVVTMRSPSAELTVEDGKTGILADDLNDFARELSSLAADNARCERMGRAAREYVARFHSIDVRAGQIEGQLYGNDGQD